jgi:hypothetical protein
VHRIQSATIVRLGAMFTAALVAAPAPAETPIKDVNGPSPHKERRIDPYLPPPVVPHLRGPATCLSLAPAGSVQVNVNAMGMNIVGDAANEPSIAIDPTNPNNIAIAWRQFDNISSNFRQAGYAFSTDAGATWTFPGVLTPGTFRSDPVLVADGFGRFFYNSLQGTFCIDVFRSADAGATWPEQFFAIGGDKAWMYADQRTAGIGAGHLYQAWSTAAPCQFGVGTFTRSIDGGETWLTPLSIPNTPVFGTVVVGPDGEVIVAGVDGPFFFNPDFVVARSTNARDPDATPTWDFSVLGNFLGGALVGGGGPNPDGLLGQVWAAINPTIGPLRGHVYILSSVDLAGDDPMDVMFSRSTDGGMTWSPPVKVNDDPAGNDAWQWFGTMSIAPNGRLDAIWNDTRDDPGNQLSRLYYSYSTDEGVTWTPNVALTPPWDSLVGFPQQNKIGDYYHMISDMTGANLAYSATFNGEQDVYFLRIDVTDCNTNGTPDDQDIAGELSTDCNSNGVPDECELDCNANGTADDCDIATLASLDCDGNGVPDECDPDCNSNGTPDACDLAAMTSQDCNSNGVPDECEDPADCNTNGTLDFCDLIAMTSQDCNANHTPDECEVPPLGGGADCNANLVPDECESQADCNGNATLDICDLAIGTSLDCNGDEIPNECQIDGTVNLLASDFEAGIPGGWLTTGLWHSTGACGRVSDCDPPTWAYYGIDVSCDFNTGGANAGVMTAPVVAIPANIVSATLTYCSAYGGNGGNSNVSGLDWAWVSANGAEVDDVSADGNQNDWEVRTVDLTALAGQNVILAFNFDSRNAFINTFLGWKVDDVRLDVVVISSLDCNGNIVPDSCEIESGATPDCNANGIPDPCEAPVPCKCGTVLGDMDGNGIVNGRDLPLYVACRLIGDPLSGCPCADLDDNGIIDDSDTGLMVACLLGLGCP